MKLSLFGRLAMALVASLALGLGMTACGGGTIAYIWVIGSQYNQIGGFKVDDYTGNLTQIVGAPFVTHGTNPVSIAVKPGGRYVFVLNQGTGSTSSFRDPNSGISVYSVGGDGTLTFQASYQSTGYIPQWLQMDGTGTYLYVLDKYSPGYDSSNASYDLPNTDGLGAITVFAVDPSDGRLSLVTNSQTQRNNLNTPFFEVGKNPFMSKQAGGCLFTLNSDNSITPYGIGGSGQLTIPSVGNYPIPGASSLSSINGGGQFIYFTDVKLNEIFQFTIGSNCGLVTPTGGGIYSNAPGLNPQYSFTDATSKYLYVLNQSDIPLPTTQPASTITGYVVNSSNSQLQPITGSPFTVGVNPVCMVEDPTSQYMYISNKDAGTVTGKQFDSTTGILSTLSRGSTFPSVGTAGCIGLSGSVDN
jgi:6-phosphogluconolactonase (cycloisomerase 2 family)